MRWKYLVLLLVIATGSYAEENSENTEETTDETVRVLREFDREVSIFFI